MTRIDATQEALYNVRAAIPEHPAVFAEWRARSDAYKAAHPGALLDLAYGQSADERLDYFPAAQPGGPLVMLIHGGYWQALDKADVDFAAAALTAAGINVAVVNYSLCPAVGLDVIVRQMRHAALWLWQEAAGLDANPDRFHVIGHSAGGHLAAMLLTIDWSALNKTAPADMIQGAVAISGLFELKPLLETSINIKVGLGQDTAAALSPVNHRPASRTPMVLAVGGGESAGFHAQVSWLQQAWAACELPITTLTLPAANHLQAFEALADSGSRLFRATLALIDRTDPA
jgi:arylformamidase